MTTELSSFVTTQELEAAWKELNVTEEARAAVLLLQASNYLRLIGRNNGIDIDVKIADDTTGVYQSNVKLAVENAVKRILSAPESMMPDVSQFSQSASPYSESMSFSAGNSSDLYFKNRELAILGISTISGKSKFGLLRGAR